MVSGIPSSASHEIPSRWDFGANMRRALNTLRFSSVIGVQNRPHSLGTQDYFLCRVLYRYTRPSTYH